MRGAVEALTARRMVTGQVECGARSGGALGTTEESGSRMPPPTPPHRPGFPSLFRAPFHTSLWKPRKMSWQQEIQRKGLEMSVSQKVNQPGSQQKTDGTFRPGRAGEGLFTAAWVGAGPAGQ